MTGNKKLNILVITFLPFMLCVNAIYGKATLEDSLHTYTPQKHPYVNATVGNIVGIPIGGFMGVIIAGGIWGIDATGNPDAGLGNVFIAAYGFYGGGIVGSATGTALALSLGRSGPYDAFIIPRNERLKLFALSLAPYILPTYLLIRGGFDADNFFDPLLLPSFAISIPFSIALPVRYYQKLMKGRTPGSLRKE